VEITSFIQLASLIATGAIVGLAVGLTGVGGGSLMTPALISGFGIPPAIAVGTDLAFAAITKTTGVIAHRSTGAIHWKIVSLMIGSSVPGCLIALWIMHGKAAGSANAIIKTTLGIALLLTAISVLFRGRFSPPKIQSSGLRVFLTLAFGLLIGGLVAWSSIGAGAIGCAVLAFIYPELAPREIAATDIAYAVPLTAVGAIGHAFSGNLDSVLLFTLLLGSVPAIWLGVRLGKQLNAAVTRGLLATLLTAAAVKSLSF
jgi:uncharacterized protein